MLLWFSKPFKGSSFNLSQEIPYSQPVRPHKQESNCSRFKTSSMQLNKKRSFTWAQLWVRLCAHGKESFGNSVRGSLIAGLCISLCWHSSLPSPPACAGPSERQHNPLACQPLLPKMIQVTKSSVPSSRSLMKRINFRTKISTWGTLLVIGLQLLFVPLIKSIWAAVQLVFSSLHCPVM